LANSLNFSTFVENNHIFAMVKKFNIISQMGALIEDLLSVAPAKVQKNLKVSSLKR